MVPRRRSRDLDLLDAVDAFERTTRELIVWRAARLGRDPLEPSRARGRWSDGSFDVIYTSQEGDGAIAEIFALLSDQPVFPSKIEWSRHRLRARVEKALVVSSVSMLSPLGVDAARYRERHYDRTQEIADAAFFLGFDALLVPSARYNCQNLVLFTEHLTIDAVELEATEVDIIDFKAWRQDRAR